MKEYQLYCAAATSAIKRRDILQLTQEKMAEDREKRKKAHDEATATGKIQKIPKLAGELEKAGIAAERSLDAMTQANEQLRVDLEKWHEAANKEMSQLMREVADNHIGYHQKVCGGALRCDKCSHIRTFPLPLPLSFLLPLPFPHPSPILLALHSPPLSSP